MTQPVHLGRRAAPAQLPLVERHTVSDSWAINTYVACDIRCTYCITSAQGESTPRYAASATAAQLRAELDAIDHIDRLVVGPYCDVYPNPEAELRVTRAALEVLHERNLPFQLITKGTTVVRDVDLLRNEKSLIQISLCSLDEEALGRLEPGAPSPDARLAALHELAALGVRTCLLASPWIPGLTDLTALLERIDPAIVVRTTPIRMPAYLTRARRALDGLTQAGVNRAYQAEYERIGPRPNLRWSRPPPLDGSPLHIRDNLGRKRIVDWTPAETAPDPGPRRSWM